MTATIHGYTVSVSQMARDMITLSGSGTPISVKDIIPSGDNRLVFSSNSPQEYNVYLYGGYLFRLLGIDTPRAGYSVHTLLLDPLSSVYYNGGTIDIITSRIHTPSRCITQEWGGTQNVTISTVRGFVSTAGPTYTIFVSFTSTNNRIMSSNGNLVRYIVPVRVGTFINGSDWMGVRCPVLDESDTIQGYYPSLTDLINDIDAITGLDASSIIDVSYSAVPPYDFSTAKNMFILSSQWVFPNCNNTYGGIKFYYYQIDRVSTLDVLNPSNLLLTPISYTYSVTADATFGLNCQEMSLFCEGRKTMDILPKNNSAVITLTPLLAYTGMNLIISQGDNTTTVPASKLPWMGDAWITYNIQKKAIDESKMWYDTIKSVISLGVGVGGAGLTSGATAMTVPASAVGIADPYFNQKWTEEETKTTPYGAGSPYGDIGALVYMISEGKPPVFISSRKYSGQPSAETALTRGLTMGYPAVGNDTISSNGYYQGEIININTSLLLNQQLINEIIGKVRRGVQT